MSKCDITKMPGYVDASKIKNKGLEMKVEQLLTAIVDKTKRKRRNNIK